MTASEQTITKYSRSNRITKSLLRQNLAVRLPTTANFVSPTRANRAFILVRAPQPFLSLGRIFASLCMSAFHSTHGRPPPQFRQVKKPKLVSTDVCCVA
jgi:hypothetical protein